MLKKLPVCPRVALRSVGGDAHAGEELRAFRLAQQVEQDGGHSALAVVFVGLNPRVMVAVGNRAFADVESQQAGAEFDGAGHLRVFHARLAGQHQRNGQRHSRRVHHPVAAESAVGYREPMAPRADRALTLGGFQRETPQARHDRLVAGRQHILGEQHHDVAVVPGLHRVGRVARRPLGFLLDQREVGGIAAGQQRERIEGTHDGILLMRGFRHFLGKRLAPLLENALRFRAVEGRGGAVAAEHREFDDDLFRLARPPAGHG